MTTSYMHATVHIHTPGGNGNRQLRLSCLFGGTARGGQVETGVVCGQKLWASSVLCEAS